MALTVVGPYTIGVDFAGVSSGGQCQFTGRPQRIGENVYQLESVRNTSGLDHSGEIQLLRGENNGEGPWTVIKTIDAGDLLGWLQPADLWSDGEILYILYAAADGSLNLHTYDPEVPFLLSTFCEPLSVPGLTRRFPDCIRLCHRPTDALDAPQFAVVYTYPQVELDTPTTVFGTTANLAGFTVPYDLTPENRAFDSQPWNMIDALVDTSDVLHVLSLSTGLGNERGQAHYSRIECDVLAGAPEVPDGGLYTTLVLPDYEFSTRGTGGTWGTVAAGRITWCVVNTFGPSPYDEGFGVMVPFIISAPLGDTSDWSFLPLTTEPIEADVMWNWGYFALVILSVAYGFFIPFYEPTTATSVELDYAEFGAAKQQLFQQLTTHGMDQCVGGYMDATSIGFCTSTDYAVSGDNVQEQYFYRMDLGGGGTVTGPASRYRGIN